VWDLETVPDLQGFAAAAETGFSHTTIRRMWVQLTEQLEKKNETAS
jgi:hypothetical protein